MHSFSKGQGQILVQVQPLKLQLRNILSYVQTLYERLYLVERFWTNDKHLLCLNLFYEDSVESCKIFNA